MSNPSRRANSNAPIWRSVLSALRQAFATGNGGAALIALVIGGIIWKLPAQDVKEVLLEVIHSPTFAVLGWVLFVTAIFVSCWIFGWKDRMHAQEIDRMAEVKKKAQQAHYTQPLLVLTTNHYDDVSQGLLDCAIRMGSFLRHLVAAASTCGVIATPLHSVSSTRFDPTACD